jgi:nitrite reductase (NO-forming)
VSQAETPAALESVADEPEAAVQAQQASVVEYHLATTLAHQPPMAFIGVGGDIDGVVNPRLTAHVGDTVTIRVTNTDPVMHDLTITEFGVTTGPLIEAGQEASVTFTVTEPGEYVYFCSVPGHQQIGMQGTLVVLPEGEAAPTAVPVAEGASVVRDPADVPPPVGDRAPETVSIELTAREVTGQLADGTTFDYFTFDGTVPGPMLRVRVGDTVNLTVFNEDGSLFPHSIDLHAVTGPGGGAVYTQTNPGDETSFTFTALNPGLYVYHCATPSVAHHIANGM